MSARRNPRPIPLDAAKIEAEARAIRTRVAIELRRRHDDSGNVGTLPPGYYVWSGDATYLTPYQTVDGRRVSDLAIVVTARANDSHALWLDAGYGFITGTTTPAILITMNGRIANEQLIKQLEQDWAWRELSYLLWHEFTHAVDAVDPHKTAQSHGRVRQLSEFGDTQRIAYFNDPREVRAYGQEAAQLALRTAEIMKARGRSGRVVLGRVLEGHSVMRMVWAEMTPHNQQRIVRMIDRALRDAGVDTAGAGELRNPVRAHRPGLLYPAQGVAKRAQRNPALPAADLQHELLSALSAPEGGIDGYDFLYLVTEYLETLGEDPLEGDEITWLEDSDNKRSFERWLLATNQLAREKREIPAGVPAYYWFNKPTALDPGTWLIHHSDKSFAAIDRGTTWETIAFTWAAREPTKAGVGNLDDIGMYDRVYAFAFTPENDACIASDGRYRCSGRRPKYGKNLLLLQCDAAVEAYHEGDEEYQAIFPVGSEYNEHRLTGNSDGSWWIEDPRTHEDVNLPTIEAVIELLSKPARKRRSKRNPSRADVVTLYHGTSSELLPNIQANGLVTEDWVYLVTTRKEAMGWAKGRVDNLQWRNLPAGTPVVLKVRVPKASLEQGLEGIFKHRGSVPASAIVASRNPTTFPKQCACGRSFTEAEWNALPLAVNASHPDGRVTFSWGEQQELRNCACGSTLARVLVDGDDDDAPAKNPAPRTRTAPAALPEPLTALADRLLASGVPARFGATDVLAWVVAGKPRLGLRGPALRIERTCLVDERRMLANREHWLDAAIQRAFFPRDTIEASRGEGVRSARGQLLDEPDAELGDVISAMERLLGEALLGDSDAGASVVLLPDEGEPHVPGEAATPYYSAKKHRVLEGRKPVGTVVGTTERYEAFEYGVLCGTDDGHAYALNPCHVAKTIDPGPLDGPVLGVFKGGLRMIVTHSFDPTQEREGAAAAIVECAGLLYPSLAYGPIPAANFGRASLVSLLPPVLDRLGARGAYEVTAYDTDAWTARTNEAYGVHAAILWAQLTGNWSPPQYTSVHMWTLGPPVTAGPQEAKVVKTTAGLRTVVKRIARAWRRGAAHSEIQAHVDANSKSYYGYGEIKVHGVYPLQAFPLCAAAPEIAEQTRVYLRAIGWAGTLIVLAKRNPDINADALEHAWQVADAVWAYAEEHRRVMVIA